MDIVGFIPKEQREVCNKWDRHHLEKCFQIAKMSKDPSTKCGCVIVRPNKTTASEGYNGFPAKMKDDPNLYNIKEEKYSRIIHCEMNALLHTTEDLNGYTAYTTPSLSCDRCCVHLIEKGITRFVGPFPFGDFGARWGPLVEKTRKYIIECGLAYTEIDIDTWEVVTNYDQRK